MDDLDINKLTYALQTVLDPAVDSTKRTAAISLCETYKNDRQCARIGFALSEAENHPTVRYFGWQLIKHAVRHKWTEHGKDEKVEIQARLLAGIRSCPDGDPLYLRSVISAVLNELAKHVWPQQWPSMLDDIFALCETHHAAATEIVLLTLLALAEDVVLYQNVAVKQRARDLRQAMTVGTQPILQFLQTAIAYQLSTLSPSNEQRRLAAVALRTLAAYLEWVNVDHIFLEGPTENVVVTLYRLLNPAVDLHVEAAECLLTLVNRKGQASERKTILKLADQSFIERYVSAIQASSGEASCQETAFNFLKISGKVLGTLAGHIIAVIPEQEKAKTEFSNTLENFKTFLGVLYRLASHDSRVIAQPCVMSWVSLLRHPELRKEPTLLSVVPHLLDLITKHLCKDYTQLNRFTAVEELDFSDDDEMLRFMKAFRSSCIELLRYSTLALPLEVAVACFETVYSNLTESARTEDRLQLKFEGLLTYLETVTGSVVAASETWNSKHRLPVAQAEKLMYLFATKNPGDPDLQRVFFSSALALCKLVALSHEPRQYFKLLLDRAFETWDETSGQHCNPTIASLRRSVGVMLIRLSKYYPGICFPLMDHLKAMIMERLRKVPQQLSPFEKVSMFESLVLISNEWKNFQAQSALVKDIIDSAAPVVQSHAFQSALRSPVQFATVVGLAQAANDQACTTARSDIYYYISLASALLGRSQLPENEEDRFSGGFYVDGKVNHPCAPHLGVAVEHIFVLTRHFSSMWASAVAGTVHPDNVKSLGLKESDKRALVSVNVEQQTANQPEEAEQTCKHHWETLQTFLHSNLSNCYNALGLASKVFERVFYYEAAVYQVAVTSLLQNLAFLPAPQLRSMLRQFLAVFFKNCPSSRALEVASPVLGEYCDILMQRLRPQWDAFAAKETARVGGAVNGSRCAESDCDDKPEEEILEEQLLRTITREHLDLLIAICINKNPPSKKETAQPDQDGDDSMRCLGMNQVTRLSDLGSALAATPACEHILTHTLVAMTWHDTTTCHKSVSILWPMLKLMMQQHVELFNNDVCRFVFEGILRGVHRHGQSDACQTQLVSLALMMIAGLPEYKTLFRGILVVALPQREAEIVDLFDTFQKKSEKTRKLVFKKLVSGIVEQHVGERFKQEPKMDVFAPFFPRSNKSAKNADDEAKIDGLARLFQPH